MFLHVYTQNIPLFLSNCRGLFPTQFRARDRACPSCCHLHSSLSSLSMTKISPSLGSSKPAVIQVACMAGLPWEIMICVHCVWAEILLSVKAKDSHSLLRGEDPHLGFHHGS